MYRILNIFLFMSCFSILTSADSTRNIADSQQLIDAILNDCSIRNGMSCLKEKVFDYLNTISDGDQYGSRSFDNQDIDDAIYNRLGKILKTNTMKFKWADFVMTYNSNDGINVNLEQPKNDARGLLKKKLLLPVILLLKLKMKALMPILVALIGFKAMKALMLSKLAIVLVLGMMVAQLIKKKLGMSMAMMPTPPPPDMAYGPPSSTVSPPDSSYGPPTSWDGSSGAYSSRIWEPAAASSHDYAYSAYYPSGSNSFNGGSSHSGSVLGKSSPSSASSQNSNKIDSSAQSSSSSSQSSGSPTIVNAMAY